MYIQLNKTRTIPVVVWDKYRQTFLSWSSRMMGGGGSYFGCPQFSVRLHLRWCRLLPIFSLSIHFSACERYLYSSPTHTRDECPAYQGQSSLYPPESVLKSNFHLHRFSVFFRVGLWFLFSCQQTSERFSLRLQQAKQRKLGKVQQIR